MEGDIYLREGNFAKAYLLYFRYSVLLMERLRNHPEFKTAEGRKAAKIPLNNLKTVLSHLEKIKPFIERDYTEWQLAEERRGKQQDQPSIDRTQSKSVSPYEHHASRDPALSSRATLLNASENQELAVELAQKEIRRRDADKRATRQAGISAEEEQARRIAAKEEIWPERASLTPAVESPHQHQRPTPPPKIRNESPIVPAKEKQQRVTFRPAAYLENGEPVRPVFLPAAMRDRFLSIAADNTRRGLEMCGILCGTAVNNALFISRLVIPEQRCTSDTCETENETSLLDYCIENDLLILGWIHTHPTQTCFMSSRDLHTQASYQVMLPESIAIVCAPRFEPSYGIFRLTNPPGLPHILQCTQQATFHQHAVDNLYTGAENPPGHVHESRKLSFEVQDLRPGFSSNSSSNSGNGGGGTVPRKNF
ncbi:putative endosome-associated ubiquitin isopeptidase protein [Eutypa lata UCREL1]|uniref:Putative endosome-associated ubiquitin isopeptidase protein n=1 Tax=Eutypa lata (strain UCR-EL1) TaxID=1287681 RepID=M7TDH4_EUTLA|nr:putative endosome-associated ubiquitin isopeptidase protein [Eutypa lata UCREL1]